MLGLTLWCFAFWPCAVAQEAEPFVPPPPTYLPAVRYQGGFVHWPFSAKQCFNVFVSPSALVLKPLVQQELQGWLSALPAPQRPALCWASKGSESHLWLFAVPPTQQKARLGVGVAALTTPYFKAGHLVHMRLAMALHNGWGEALAPSVLQGVLRHELGHALGLLGHSPNPTDCLFAYRLNSQAAPPKPLSEADKETLRQLYRQVLRPLPTPLPTLLPLPVSPASPAVKP
jgi:hypothetical protein